MRDAVIVGGGPAGSRTAALLARDSDVLVLEEHPASGIPEQCAGLVTEEVVRLSGVRPDILSRIYGADVVFPDGTVLSVHSDDVKAVAIDRADMDSRMADAAMAAGAEFSFRERYLSHTVSDRVEVEASKGRHVARVLIGADGHTSSVASSIPDNAPREYLRGMQADVSVRMEHQDRFRIHLGSSVAPGFFAWEIPCGDYTRVGLCTSWSAGPPMDHLGRLLRRVGAEDRVIRLHGGKIPVGGVRTICADRVALVGDSACQVKPVSGGGLYPGLTAAAILSDVIRGLSSDDDFSAKKLKEYQSKCDRAFGRELRNGYRLRRMFLRMGDDDLNAAGRYASREDVRSVLDQIDLDHPSRVVREVLGHPSAAVAAVPLVLRCIF